MKVQLASEDERVVERWMERGFTSPEEVVHYALNAIDHGSIAVEAGEDIDEAIRQGLAELDRGERVSPADAIERLERRKQEWLSKQSLG